MGRCLSEAPDGMLRLGIEGYELVNVLARIAETRNLVLSSQLAFSLEPLVEETWLGNNDFKRLEGDVLMALCLIVGIDGLQ
mgnify:CR=1 FL=1